MKLRIAEVFLKNKLKELEPKFKEKQIDRPTNWK